MILSGNSEAFSDWQIVSMILGFGRIKKEEEKIPETSCLLHRLAYA